MLDMERKTGVSATARAGATVRVARAARAALAVLAVWGAAGVAAPAVAQTGAPAVAQPAAAADAAASAAPAPDAARQRVLLHMLRQDCGMCHGIRMTGGLGLPLTPQALAGKPFDSLVATVYHGRPGTAMPGWKSMITEAEAAWMVRVLQQGLPETGAAAPVPADGP